MGKAKSISEQATAKAEEIKKTPFRQIPGAHVIKPLKDIRASDRLRFTAQIAVLLDEEGNQIGNTQEVLLAIADACDLVEECMSTTPEEFQEWAGSVDDGSLIELLMALYSELGEGKGSTS